jgi:DNA-directed RNA polymerase specialized sigma24 family protein
MVPRQQADCPAHAARTDRDHFLILKYAPGSHCFILTERPQWHKCSLQSWRGQSAYVPDVVLDEMTAPSASPLAQLISREQITQGRQSLARLPPLDRDTPLAFYHEGQSLATISQQAAAPVGTIKRRLHVARQRLRQELAWVE